MADLNLQQSLILVITGAGLGFIPTYLTTRAQAAFQYKQMLTDRKIAELNEFSKAIGTGTDIQSQARLVRDALWSTDMTNQQSIERYFQQMLALHKTMLEWHKQIDAHKLLIFALFKKNLDLRSFITDDMKKTIRWDTDPSKTTEQRKEQARNLLTAIDKQTALLMDNLYKWARNTLAPTIE